MNNHAERILDESPRATPNPEEAERGASLREGIKLLRSLREVIAGLRADFIGTFMPTAEKRTPGQRLVQYNLQRRLAEEILSAQEDIHGLKEDLDRLNNRAQKFAEAQGINID